MANTEQVIKDFSTRVRLLLGEYEKVKVELEKTKKELEIQKQNAKDMELLATAYQKDYENLKMARMLEVSGVDIDDAQKRIQRLIRDVNKCITLIGEQQ